MKPQKIKIFFQKIKNIFWHLPKSIFYNFYFGYPSHQLTLIGVTGTDGKTTVVNLIHQALLNSGIKTGSISTLGAKIGDRDISVGLHTTSPDSRVVQNIFKDMVAEGITHAVIEVTAHALDQYRFYGCNFAVATITNTSHEHLDDFANMKAYIATKSKLFSRSQLSILNRDDPSYEIIKSRIAKKHLTYSTKTTADYRARNIKMTSSKLSFSINEIPFSTNSTYIYQVQNILATFAILDVLKISSKVTQTLIKDFPAMKGRREIVNNDLDVRCLVDFAHTPAALKATLSAVKSTSLGKTIVIFGATGGRDQSKRPMMGKIASEIADIAIITSDDTRHEKIENINNQIISGISQSRIKNGQFTYHNVPNRQEAFNLAVKLAKPKDTIIACGKGHENTILHGNTEYPWSESEAFRTAFRYLATK
jgi:UDP-N-acetylmuramoyl-L-alanyl-D-glutamate--2,6-diaminopimelate ligase